MQKRFFITAAVLVVLAIGIELAVRLWSAPGADQDAKVVQQQAGPRIPDVALTDHDGERFDQARFYNRWTFLFFGFTHCPDVCPMTLAMLARVWDRLEAQGLDLQRTQVVMVSVDPDRDDKQRLRTYMTSFQPEFIGVRGDKQQLDAFASPLGVAYEKVLNHGGGHGHTDAPADGSQPTDMDHGHMGHGKPKPTTSAYDVNHTPAVLLVGPDARVAKLLTPPHAVEEVVSAYLQHVGEAQETAVDADR